MIYSTVDGQNTITAVVFSWKMTSSMSYTWVHGDLQCGPFYAQYIYNTLSSINLNDKLFNVLDLKIYMFFSQKQGLDLKLKHFCSVPMTVYTVNCTYHRVLNLYM